MTLESRIARLEKAKEYFDAQKGSDPARAWMCVLCDELLNNLRERQSAERAEKAPAFG